MLYKLLSANAEINTWFRLSKLPKVIRICIAKIMRLRVNRRMKKFANSDKRGYNSSLIYELCTYCSTKHMPYGYINGISIIDEPKNRVYEMTLTYVFGDPGRHDVFKFYITSRNTGMDVKIRKVTEKGTATIMKTTLGDLGLGFDNIDRIINNDSERSMLRGLNSMIGEILQGIFKDEIERSERIYEI